LEGPTDFGEPRATTDNGGQDAGNSLRPPNSKRKESDKSRHLHRPKRREEFAALCAEHERRLYTYILALVANRTETEEILQETLLVLWEKFDTFTAGTNFLAWAYAVARLEVLKHRERQSRERRVLSLEAVYAISTEIYTATDTLDQRHAALAECLDKLTERQRTIVQQRYQAGMAIDSLAERLGRSRDAVYQILSRIRRSLEQCIDRSIASGSRK
jgi:RNA polymerase sigma-70 factor (ECF subfamily)